jgi:uncharacterized metal-binding protein YceD (DUF177 family)
MSAAILSRPVAIVDLPAAAVDVVAAKAEREALAAANDLVAVNVLSAEVELSQAGGGEILVEGHVVADIVQTCVVSLAPVDAHIDEVFSVRYVRDASKLPPLGVELAVEAEAPDPPELLEGTTIDVGALVEEYFVLGIDPYPRALGARLPAELAKDADSGEESPFAILARLSRPQSGSSGNKK